MKALAGPAMLLVIVGGFTIYKADVERTRAIARLHRAGARGR